jgi:hypothetical protein
MSLISRFRVASFALLAIPFALSACGSSPPGAPSDSAVAATDGAVPANDLAAASDGGSVDAGPITRCSGSGATGFNPYKHAFFGDLHLHTSYSLDAYSFATRSDPNNAYLFAKGKGTVHVGSGTGGLAGPDITQARPIDFLAVTDHSEWLMITHGCTIDKNSGYYNSSDCGLVQSTKAVDQDAVFAKLGSLKKTLCANGADCATQEKSAWQDIITAANTANDPCQFTSLVAYEWTDSKQVVDQANNMPTGVTNHRNVIFATDKVPDAPLDSADFPDPPALWTGLDNQCTAANGCEAITIPHNTNISAGVSLVVWDPTPAGVKQQQKYQVAAEIYQHKGASECYYNPAAGYNDADCQFEYFSPQRAVNLGPGSFVREGLGTGIGYAAQNPVQGNPLQLGIVGATDDHNGAPGNVDEAAFVGHAGRLDDYPVKRLQGGSSENGSGALTGAWAEQNTRDSIFAAIRRRETFATSGPRIQVRFYQTGDANACADAAFPKQIVDANDAVPMGGTFGKGAKPMFALTAWPDAVPQSLADNTMAVAGLAKVQIIKVHAKVVGGKPVVVEDAPYAVAGIPATGGCAMWSDPGFDATENALYYVRVLQVPTWRWSHHSCLELQHNNPNTWQTLVPECKPGGTLDVSIQERAWSSPIWYVPTP